ncbi:chemotaxis protein CheA [Clostridiales bacterium COT073_COT-073]|nr:chemotaxis protein CheA [Clostridiales bacterium COT073_COT-073]
MDTSQYLEIFIEESKEHLQSLNETLLVLENSPDEVDMINSVFRVAHTLKGMAGTMGFKRMNSLTHNMENVLAEIRTGNIHITPELLDILFQCLDALEQYVEEITNTGNEGEEAYESIISQLNDILKNGGTTSGAAKESSATPLLSPEKTDESKGKANKTELNEYEKNIIKKANESGMLAFALRVKIDEKSMLKAARAFIVYKTLEDMGEIIRTEPSTQDIEEEKFDQEFRIFIVTEHDKEQLFKEVSSVSEVAEVEVDLIEISDELATEEVPAVIQTPAAKTVELEKAVEKPKAAQPAQSKGDSGSKPKTNTTVRVDVERLDNLMNLVSELIIVKNGLETVGKGSQNANEQIEYLERITTNLHESVMKVRMVPVERVFNRFPRLIRDLSRNLNKKMELEMSGEETEIDRTVIDEIGDPLVHLIRNSADHGLEKPEVRISRGKDEVGHVYLDAYQDGNNVVIEVSDDGNGIDVERVRAKAIEKGAISEEEAAAMKDNEVIGLLFRPSFSTAEQISDVSGRGVGLDVVKTKIESLGGDIEVKTELTKGSKFIIRLPLTLAIIQGLMVELAGEKYAIPLSSIQTIEDVDISEIKYVQNEEVIHLRNKVIPICHLEKNLGIVRQEEQTRQKMTVVIVNRGEKLLALAVDSLIGQQEVVIKNLGQFLGDVKNIAGATILGNGEVALILDVNSLF